MASNVEYCSGERSIALEWQERRGAACIAPESRASPRMGLERQEGNGLPQARIAQACRGGQRQDRNGGQGTAEQWRAEHSIGTAGGHGNAKAGTG